MSVVARPRKRETKVGSPFPSLEAILFPPGYKLLIGTSQIYELELATAEATVLGADEIVDRGAYFASVKGTKTKHFRMCAVSPLQVDSASSARRRTFFEANLFKTGYATHGLFPYRGKFHPQMVKAIINVIGLKPGDTLLDPMMGSGTACLEASLQGVHSIGIDASPFCVLMAEGKRAGAAASGKEVASLADRTDELFDRFDSRSDPQPLLFRRATNGNGKPKKEVAESGLEAFLRLCYLDAVGYSARRASKSVRQLFPVVMQRYVAAVSNFSRVRDELRMELGKASYRVGDARDLHASGIADESIDGIVTSPPYSFAIDYLANDADQLHYLGVDADKLKDKMIGLRGTVLTDRVANYFEDMRTILAECYRVLKPGSYIVVVVGTNSNQLKRVMGVNGEDLKIDREVVRLAELAGFGLGQDVIHPIEGIHNTLRDEHLLFFRKD